MYQKYRCKSAVQLICAFVFTYAKSWFSHDVAQDVVLVLTFFCVSAF